MPAVPAHRVQPAWRRRERATEATYELLSPDPGCVRPRSEESGERSQVVAEGSGVVGMGAENLHHSVVQVYVGGDHCGWAPKWSWRNSAGTSATSHTPFVASKNV